MINTGHAHRIPSCISTLGFDRMHKRPSGLVRPPLLLIFTLPPIALVHEPPPARRLFCICVGDHVVPASVPIVVMIVGIIVQHGRVVIVIMFMNRRPLLVQNILEIHPLLKNDISSVGCPRAINFFGRLRRTFHHAALLRVFCGQIFLESGIDDSVLSTGDVLSGAVVRVVLGQTFGGEGGEGAADHHIGAEGIRVGGFGGEHRGGHMFAIAEEGVEAPGAALGNDVLLG
mmetsp:Transcript_3845/g.7260  ORF Transcript_3845/g.7260 Transcript_3845/m.7260 type:complete len:230 (-) Transcript_3845:269-958(-)